jgi:hypothetical protein
VRGGGGLLPAPAGFKLSRGTVSGTLIAHATSLSGAASYQLQPTEGDATSSNGWLDA